VVLHSWWGLTQGTTDVCDDLAALGYVAVAPDLYQGKVASTPEEAAVLRSRRRSTPMWRQIVQALESTRSRYGAQALGQIGFSMGGHWALWLAKQLQPEIPPISATVVYYASRAGDFSTSVSAFQLHLAGADPFVSPASIARVKRQLRLAGPVAEFHEYPGTSHWFAERDQADAYRPAAAALAWERTVAFLDRYLPE
jgi:carboxymethylenebutenolidase